MNQELPIPRFFTISRWTGPEFDDFKMIHVLLNVHWPSSICKLIPDDNSHLFHIAEWDRDPDDPHAEILDQINGEEFKAQHQGV